MARLVKAAAAVAFFDPIFFEYTPKETSAVVWGTFKDFSGYMQFDAKSVYDVLLREPEEEPPAGVSIAVRHEVGCWSHNRRKYWEATAAKSAVAREGLMRIGRISCDGRGVVDRETVDAYNGWWMDLVA